MRKTAIATLLPTALFVVACAGPVAVPVPTPTSATVQRVCSDLSRQLPSAVINLAKRTTEPTNELVAAWGNPPVTLRCGAPAPVVPPTVTILTIANVEWFGQERSAGYVFFTVGRVATVEVAVPDVYQPETAVLADLANAIRASDPLTVFNE